MNPRWASIRANPRTYDLSATAQTTFKPNAKKIVEHRKKLGWSRRAFASESGADEKTIRAIEEGRRDACQPDTLQKFAAAFEKGGLACTWTDLVLSDTPVPKLPPRSSLDPLVKAERRLEKQPRLTTVFGPLKRFGASELADTFTAYGVHEGKRYYVDGTIEHQRGLSDADCQVLQVRGGHGGKFELMRVIDPELDPLLLVVWSRTSAHTVAIQKAHRKGVDVRAVVRIIVADFHAPELPPDHVAITNFLGGTEPLIRPTVRADERWKGFAGIAPHGKGAAPKPHPWALLVESVEPIG